MTFADLYLICFIVGFALSVVSFLLGDLHLHIHLPFHLHFGDFGGAHAPHVGGAQMAVINFGTITTFLAWFGGVGYLLTRHSSLYAMAALGLAIGAGLIGATMVFMFVSRVLLKHDKSMDPADYEMVGVLGRICSSIREGGTGELLYSQDGTRKVSGARSEHGTAIAKGTEVVVTRYEKGIAYVRPWDELTGQELEAQSTDSK
jgi:membrane protein implicated in regulation of membrane protease activity